MLREHAEAIEADLLFRGIDIFDWYQGRMSDRRLLALIKNLPEDSAFKQEFRKDWPLRDHLIAANLNATMALRSDIWAAFFHQKLPFKPVLSPSAERSDKSERNAVRSLHDSIIEQIKSGGDL